MNDLERFVSAQNKHLDKIYNELYLGLKASHWVWFVFPQLIGLGSSLSAIKYGIKSLEEARSYIDHALLSERYDKCCQLLLRHKIKPISNILGFPDNLKLCSSLTLFCQVANDDALYIELLYVFYNGKQDKVTLSLLRDY